MFWYVISIAALILFVIGVFVILVVISASKLNDNFDTEKEDREWECLKRL